MANSSSEQHIIPLEEPDLNLSRYDNDVKQYQGYNDRVGPYIGGESLPVFYKTFDSVGDSWMAKNEDLYFFSITDLKHKDAVTGTETVIQPNMNAVVVNELSPTFTYQNNTYTGEVLGGTGRLYGIWYDNYAYIIYNGICIGKTSNTANYSDAVKYWSIVEYAQTFTYDGSTVRLLCYCFGGRCQVFVVDNGTAINYSFNALLSTNSGLAKVSIAPMYTGGIAYACSLNSNYLVYFTPTKDSGGIHITWNYTQPDWLSKVILQPSYPTEILSFGRRQIDKPIMVATARTAYYASWITGASGTTYSQNLEAFNIVINSTTIAPLDEFISSGILNSLPTPFTLVDDIYGEGLIVDRYTLQKTAFYHDDLDDYSKTMVMTLCKPNESSSDFYFNKSEPTLGIGKHIKLFYDTNLTLILEAGRISTISTGDGDHSGNLIFPWGSVEDLFIYHDWTIAPTNPDEIGVKVNGKWYSVQIKEEAPSGTIYKNRFIMLNTASWWNVYDMDKHVWLHAFDDWCNDIGSYISNFLDSDNKPYPSIWRASQFMSNYLSEDYPFPGRAWEPVMIRRSQNPNRIQWTSGTYGTGAKTADPISYTTLGRSVDVHLDFYKTDNVEPTEEALQGNYGDFTPLYWTSDKAKLSQLVGLLWTSEIGNILMNLPMFTKYTTTLLTVAHHIYATNFNVPLLVEGLVETGLYYLLSVDENLTNLFSLQTNPYGVSDGYISKVGYKEGIISILGRCTETGTLEYKTANSALAYYWSNSDRCIYSFNGDGILRNIKAASKLQYISESKYNPATQEIYMITDRGLLVAHNSYMYMIPGSFYDVFITDYGFALKGINAQSRYMISSYSYFNPERYQTQLDAMLETCYYGYSDHTITTTDCIYIRVHSESNVGGWVKVSGKVMTDIDTELEIEPKTYTITETDWNDGVYYIRYQPTYQKGVGMSIKVESEFPITFLAFGSRPETLQITKR